MLFATLALLAVVGEPPADSDVSFWDAVPTERVVEVGGVRLMRRREPDQAYFELPIARPITPEDMTRWSWRLSLSEAQRSFVRELYKDYLDDEADLFEKHIRPLWDESVTIAEQSGHSPTDPASASAMMELVSDKIPAAERHIIALEERLIRNIETGLADGQQRALTGLESERSRLRMVYPSPNLGAQVDVVVLLHALMLQGLELPPLSDSQFGAIVAEYDREAERLLGRRHETQLQLLALVYIVLSQAESSGYDRLYELNRRLADIERSIVRLNEDCLSRLATVLVRDAHKELDDRFREIAYPAVYPDPTDLSPLFRELARVDTMSPDQRIRLDALQGVYRAQASELCKRMQKEHADWIEKQTIQSSRTPERVTDYESAMAELHQLRVANAKLLIDQIRNDMGEKIDSIEETLQSFEEALDRIDYDPRNRSRGR